MATIGEIAKLVGASAPLAVVEIDCVSSIEAATHSSLVFATDAATLAAALQSSAGAIFTRTALLTSGDDYLDPRLIAVADPRYAFALAARFLRSRQQTASASQIHPTAVLGTNVRVGKGSSIGPHAVLGDGVVIGEQCEVLANVTIYSATKLGNRVLVQAGAVLGATGFGYARSSATGQYIAFPQQGTLAIEDDVEIGANSTIDRGALSETRIRRGTKIDNLVHVGHNCDIGEDVILVTGTGISGSCTVGKGAVIAGQVGIGDHAHIGPGVILGGQAGVLSGKTVTNEGLGVKPGTVLWGTPARPLPQVLREIALVSRMAKRSRKQPEGE